MAPNMPTTKRLFANSRNQCAFEGCSTKLVTDQDVVVGRICHIRASSARGPRFDPTQTEEERDGYDNLLLLCGPHHDVIDKQDVSAWTVERLEKMKEAHEALDAGAEASASMPGEDRACQQLIQNTSIYNSGLYVGSMVAETINIFHRSNVALGSSGSSSKGAEPDKELLEEIIAQLGGETRRFLDEHDFGGSFKRARFDPIDEFEYLARQPHKEFIEPTVEGLRQQLVDAIRQFLLEIAVSTFVQNSAPKYSRIATFDDVRPGLPADEWEAHRLVAEKRFRRDQAKLNNLARDVVEKYDALVRAARTALAQ